MSSENFRKVFVLLLFWSFATAVEDNLSDDDSKGISDSEVLSAILNVADDPEVLSAMLVETPGDEPIKALLATADANTQVTENNIAFDLPDLTLLMETTSGEFQMEAYKSINNDRILSEEGKVLVQKTGQLIWVSTGQPQFVKTKVQNTNVEKLFHTSTSGFYTYVQMLTTAMRKLLVKTANSKYGITIGEHQIVNLILSKFECSLFLYDESGNKYLLKGTVGDFRNFPLRINFIAPRGSIERKLFTEEIGESGENADLEFTCNMASRGKVMRTNILSINSEQMEQLGLEDKLFGTSPSVTDVFVTRDQTTELSRELYSTLNIVEDYQMPELQFSEAFVGDLINQAATSHFTMVPIATVLASLSSYGFDTSGDLKADVIRRDLGEVLQIEKSDSKSRIILNEEYYSKNIENSGSSGSGRLKIYGLLKSSAKFARNNAKSDTVNTKSLFDQLNELNTQSKRHQVGDRGRKSNSKKSERRPNDAFQIIEDVDI